MKVISSTLGFGEIGLNGALGFREDSVASKIRLTVPYDDAIGAHANSQVVIEVAAPTRVCGALNGSANLLANNSGPCEFWLNYHWLGDLTFGCTTTPWIDLPPGTYMLRVKATNNHYGAHSIWLLKEGGKATHRVALITASCFREAELKKHLFWLYRSAAKAGLLVHCFGTDTQYTSHYDIKIPAAHKLINDLPSCYDKILYMDGRDSFVLGTEEELAAKFASNTLMSAECGCWPDRRQEWSRHFQGDTDQLYPNAGMWCGPRDVVKKDLENLEALNDRCQNGHRIGDLNSTYYFNNDQHVWQAYMIYGGGQVNRDTRMDLFCTLGWVEANLNNTGRVKAEDGRLVTEYGTRPLCIHFPGSQLNKMTQWASFLGL